MEKQLFAIAAVDNLGKHVFIRKAVQTCELIKTCIPGDAVYIGHAKDIEELIQRCRNELYVEQPVKYIPYTVKSNLTELEFYDNAGNLCGLFAIH